MSVYKKVIQHKTDIFLDIWYLYILTVSIIIRSRLWVLQRSINKLNEFRKWHTIYNKCWIRDGTDVAENSWLMNEFHCIWLLIFLYLILCKLENMSSHSNFLSRSCTVDAYFKLLKLLFRVFCKKVMKFFRNIYFNLFTFYIFIFRLEAL